jgi:hypothetical protein
LVPGSIAATRRLHRINGGFGETWPAAASGRSDSHDFTASYRLPELRAAVKVIYHQFRITA